MAFWLTTKLDEKCACGSGKAYRVCCLRRETAFFAIMAVAAAALFVGVSGNDPLVFTVVLLTVILLAGGLGWVAKKSLK